MDRALAHEGGMLSVVLDPDTDPVRWSMLLAPGTGEATPQVRVLERRHDFHQQSAILRGIFPYLLPGLVATKLAVPRIPRVEVSPFPGIDHPARGKRGQASYEKGVPIGHVPEYVLGRPTAGDSGGRALFLVYTGQN